MSDLMKDALRKHRITQERTAKGEVDGKDIILYKDKMFFRWRLSVIIEGELIARQHGKADSIESEFHYYMSEYDLEEVEE